MTLLNLYDADSSKAIDALVIKRFKMDSVELMRRAGQRALVILLERWPEIKSISVFCGMGNNGGDGYVLALLAKKIGLNVQVYVVGDQRRIKDDARIGFDECLRNEVNVMGLDQFDGQSDLIVDAIFGVGLNRKIEGDTTKAITIINDSSKPVLSIDVPSGLNASTGGLFGTAVKADLTISFFGMKQGLFTGAGKSLTGDSVVDFLGIPSKILTECAPTAMGVNYKSIKSSFAPRDLLSHKGDFGHLLVLGGAPGYAGAVLLCGMAALRSGVGLISIGTHPDHANSITASRPELMCHAISGESELSSLIGRASVVAIGPGLSRRPWATRVLKCLEEAKIRCVYDADALNLLSSNPNFRSDRVITPHVKEASRLLKIEPKDIESNRILAARKLVLKYGGTTLLKGPGTVIVHEDDIPMIILDGNPGMASGGMGDVLTGVVGSFLAQKIEQKKATILAGVVHSHAADLASQKWGERGLAASDLMDYLRFAVNPRD